MSIKGRIFNFGLKKVLKEVGKMAEGNGNAVGNGNGKGLFSDNAELGLIVLGVTIVLSLFSPLWGGEAISIKDLLTVCGPILIALAMRMKSTP